MHLSVEKVENLKAGTSYPPCFNEKPEVSGSFFPDGGKRMDKGCGFEGSIGRKRRVVCEGELQLLFLLEAGVPERAEDGCGSWWVWTSGFHRENLFCFI